MLLIFRYHFNVPFFFPRFNVYIIGILCVTCALTDAIISISVDVEYELAEAEGYVRAMDVEFRSMPSADKKSILAKVQLFV